MYNYIIRTQIIGTNWNFGIWIKTLKPWVTFRVWCLRGQRFSVSVFSVTFFTLFFLSECFSPVWWSTCLQQIIFSFLPIVCPHQLGVPLYPYIKVLSCVFHLPPSPKTLWQWAFLVAWPSSLERHHTLQDDQFLRSFSCYKPLYCCLSQGNAQKNDQEVRSDLMEGAVR